MMLMLRTRTLLLVPALALAFAACGGGSGPASSTVSPPGPTTPADMTPPSTPTGLTAVAAGSSVINLSWNASTDNVGVTGYIVTRAGILVATPVTTSYEDTGLSAGTTYNYTVAALDAAGNISLNSTSASATTADAGTGTGDTTRPSTPTGLAATAGGDARIDLSWNASTDNVGVTGYIVRRNGTPVATPVAISYADTAGLSPGTTYRYTVAALDAAGNSSFLSTSASAATTGTPPPRGTIPSTLGWFQIPDTRLRSVCPPGVPGNTGCASVTLAWSGGAFDTTRNRLLIWGGGHGDYAGNEVYALELDTLTLQRLNDPSTPVRDGCSNGYTYADGKPVARHTYNHLAYLPNQDAMFAWGGSPWQCGGFAHDAWLFNLGTPAPLSWTPKSNTNGPATAGTFGLGAAYDPNTGLVYMQDWSDLRAYNPSTNVWTKRSSSPSFIGAVAAVIDPVRKKYFMHGNNSTTLFWYDISSPTALVRQQSAPTTGCSGFIGNDKTGMEYDPIQNRIIGWNGGNTIYILNPDTLSCTTVSHLGGPADLANGTYGRFRYSPSLNVFVVCNSVDVDCYALRLTP